MLDLINVTSLKEVSETLLITLYARYLETKRENGIIKDWKAVEIVEQIDYDFSQVTSWSMQAVIAIRTEIIDEVVRDFLTRNPQGIIVNLGAGLCTRFFRLDNGVVNWYELDLPRVKPIWDKLLGESERHKYLSYSVMDFEWIERVKENNSEKVLFIAEGLFQYLNEVQVKKIILTIKRNFPNSEILFEALGVLTVKKASLDPVVSRINDLFQWGIDDLKEIESWDRGIKLIAQWYYSDRHKNRQGWIKWLGYIPILRKQSKIGHLQFL